MGSALQGTGLVPELLAQASARGTSRRNLEHNRAALDLIVEAVGKAGFTPGQDIALAIDAAASEFYADDMYNFEGHS